MIWWRLLWYKAVSTILVAVPLITKYYRHIPNFWMQKWKKGIISSNYFILNGCFFCWQSLSSNYLGETYHKSSSGRLSADDDDGLFNFMATQKQIIENVVHNVSRCYFLLIVLLWNKPKIFLLKVSHDMWKYEVNRSGRIK